MQEHPDKNLVDHEDSTDDAIYVDGALPKKKKLLIAMAFAAAYGAISGWKSLAQSAMKAGATKEEIVEASRIANHLGAG